MAPVLYLSHAVLATVAALIYVLAPTAVRSLRIVALVGCASGIALVIAADDIGAWRTTSPAPVAGAVAGAAVAVAWGLVAASSARPARSAIATGVAAASLALFAASEWVVPACLFLGCALLATGALVSLGGGRALGWVSIATAGAGIVAALGATAVDLGRWDLVEPSGAYLGLGYGGAIVAMAVVPVSIWQVAGSAGITVLPLLVGVGFVTVDKLGGPAEPWLAAGLLVLALGLAVVAWVARLTVAAVAAWSGATFAAIAFASPDATVVTGVAAVIATGVIALWPQARGRGRMSRGLIASYAPPTIAFGALLAAEARAFTEATATPDLDVAWSATAALLPLVLAAGVVIGCGMARTPESDEFEPAAVLATWALLGAAVVAGAFLQSVAEVPAVVARSSVPVVYPVALGAGIFVAVRVPHAVSSATSIAAASSGGVLALRRSIGSVLISAAAVIALLTVAGIGWLTIEGLSVGFL